MFADGGRFFRRICFHLGYFRLRQRVWLYPSALVKFCKRDLKLALNILEILWGNFCFPLFIKLLQRGFDGSNSLLKQGVFS